MVLFVLNAETENGSRLKIVTMETSSAGMDAPLPVKLKKDTNVKSNSDSQLYVVQSVETGLSSVQKLVILDRKKAVQVTVKVSF